MITRRIRSFAGLHKLFLSHGHSHYIYRGESSAKYELRPKIGRYNVITRDDAADQEVYLLEAFKRRASPHVSLIPSNDWEWLAVAQHYGLATRLLDWTENLLVAAYFATVLTRTDHSERIIYALDSGVLHESDETISPFELDNASIYRPKHITNRISAQSGLFTVHPNPAEKFTHDQLERIVISKNAVLDISIALDKYGFNKATMFPGLDGVAFHINDWHLRGERDDIPV